MTELEERVAQIRSAIASLPTSQKAEVRVGDTGTFIAAVERSLGYSLKSDPRLSGMAEFCGLPVILDAYLPPHTAVLMVDREVSGIFELRPLADKEGG